RRSRGQARLRNLPGRPGPRARRGRHSVAHLDGPNQTVTASVPLLSHSLTNPAPRMKTAPTLLVVGLATTGWSLTAAQPDLSKLPPPSAKAGLTYAKDIRPLFETACFNCHGERRQRAGLRLDSLE